MAKTYEKKPDLIQAMEFTEAHQGPEIVNWIISEGGMAVYLSPIEEVKFEDGTIAMPGRPASIRMSTQLGTANVALGNYVLRNKLQGIDWQVMPAQQFELLYEEYVSPQAR